MENQHKLITGYRDLSQAEIDAMNLIKERGREMEQLVAWVRNTPDVDQRWASIGATHLQEGCMALTRAIAKPTSF